jgi:phage/plasmid-associated DNA primase
MTYLASDQTESLLNEYLTQSDKYRNHDKRWDCPSCGAGNVSIREKDGAVKCWSCEAGLKQILTAAGGWQDYLETAFPDQWKDGKRVDGEGSIPGRPVLVRTRKASRKKTRSYPAMDVPKVLRLLELSSPSFCQVQNEYHQRTGSLVETFTFEFSSTQMIKRFNLSDGKKDFKFLHKAEGSDRWVAGKGEKEFPPYRMNEVLSTVKSGINSNKPNAVLMTEGETCADYVRHYLKKACISVDGSSWNAKAIGRTALALKKLGLSLVYLMDNDAPGHKKAALVKEKCRAVGVYCLVIDLAKSRWKGEIGTGQDIADVIKKGRTMDELEKFMSDVEAEFEALSEDLEDEVDQQHKKELEEALRLNAMAPMPGEVGHPEVKPAPQWLAEKIVNDQFKFLRWVPTDGNGSWWGYVKPKGIWEKLQDEDVKALAIAAWKKDAEMVPMTIYALNSIMCFLKVELRAESLSQPRFFVPFKNGVLNSKTGIFSEHHPRHHLLWTLPYDYQEPNGKNKIELMKACGPIIPWLHEATGSKQGNLELVHLLLCYLAAVMRGMTHLQKYLECIGPPGTGKGTFLRIAQAVMGGRNTTSTSLSKLESSKFEQAKVSKAPLVIISDAERFAGSCLVLQSLTGQDVMSGEKKGIQEEVGDGQAATGMVILAGESIPKTSGSTGVNRRRITVPFTRQVSERNRKNLLTIETVNKIDHLSGEFAPYIPSLVNLILSYSEQEITEFVGHTSITVKALTESKAENIIQTNPLAAWADEHLIWDDALAANGLPELSARVGRISKDNQSWQDLAWSQLYPSYVNWCHFNNCKPIAGNSFSPALIELFNHQLGLPIFKRSERDGSRIYGISVRPDNALPTEDETVDGLSYERPITTTYVKKEMGKRKLQSQSCESSNQGCGEPTRSVVDCGEPVVSRKPEFWDTLDTLPTFGSEETNKEVPNCHKAGTPEEEILQDKSADPESNPSSPLPGFSDTTPKSEFTTPESKDTTFPDREALIDPLAAAQILSSISNGQLIHDNSGSDVDSSDPVGQHLPLHLLPKDDTPLEVWDNCESQDE